jgi:hypothetical protein
MATTKISLRVIGQGVVPEVVSRIAGRQPTHAFKFGDSVGKQGCAAAVKRAHGLWSYQLQEANVSEVQLQISDLLRMVPRDFTAQVRQCAAEHVDLFIGVFGVEDQTSIELDADILREIGERGWSICFDMYT